MAALNFVGNGSGEDNTTRVFHDPGNWSPSQVPTINDALTVRADIVGMRLLILKDAAFDTMTLVGNTAEEVRGLEIIKGARVRVGTSMTVTTNNWPAVFNDLRGTGLEAFHFVGQSGGLYTMIESTGSSQCWVFDGFLIVEDCEAPVIECNSGDLFGRLIVKNSSLRTMFSSPSATFSTVRVTNGNLYDNFNASKVTVVGGNFAAGAITVVTGCVPKLYGVAKNATQGNANHYPLHGARPIEGMFKRAVLSGVLAAITLAPWVSVIGLMP